MEDKILWNDEYKIGIKGIDKQHRELFDIVNRLYKLDDISGTKEKVRAILYKFNEYMKIHFKDEENYMQSIGYPDLQSHKQLHKDIIDNLSKIVHTPAKLNIIKSKIKVMAKRGLIDHIIHEDTKVKLFLINKGEDIDEEIFEITQA